MLLRLGLRLASLPPHPALPSQTNSTVPSSPLSFNHRSPSPSPSLSLSSFNRTIDYLSRTLRIDPHRALFLNPSLRTHPFPSLRSSHSLLLSIGLSPSQISRVFSIHPNLLTHPFHPSLHFLLSLLPPPSLCRSLSRCPRLLSCPVDTQLSPAVHFLKRLSIPITSKTSILLAAHVESTLLPKIDFLQSIGLSYNEVKLILRRSPMILTYSVEDNLKPKIEFLKNELKLDVRRELRRFPQYLAFSLENRIKRRYSLVTQKGVEMGLEEMLRTSDGDFDQRILERKLGVVDEIMKRKGRTQLAIHCSTAIRTWN